MVNIMGRCSYRCDSHLEQKYRERDSSKHTGLADEDAAVLWRHLHEHLYHHMHSYARPELVVHVAVREHGHERF